MIVKMDSEPQEVLARLEYIRKTVPQLNSPRKIAVTIVFLIVPKK